MIGGKGKLDKILLFIPAYNCENQIIRVLDQIDRDILKYISEVIVVNNRSTDNTEKTIISYINMNKKIPLRLLRNDENYGLGGSHKIAFNYAVEHEFEYIIVLHGDDQGNINDLKPYLNTKKYRKFDSLLGSRFLKQSKLINYSKFRIFGNHVFNILVSLVTHSRVSDLGAGLNLYKTEYLKEQFYMGFPDTLTFNVYLLLYGIYSESKFRFFPLSWREEDQISNARFFKQSREILFLLFRFLFDRKKLFAVKKKAENYTYEIIYDYKKCDRGEER